MFRIFIPVCILSLLFCAHKGPPIRIDRVDPKLVRAVPINERQIMLSFSEDLDTLSIQPENFVVYSAEETLSILAAAKGNNINEVFLATARMRTVDYRIEGRVFDKSGRAGLFKSNFRGSAKPDTIAPWLTSYSKGARQHRFFLEFSEPVDTLSFKYSIIPKRQMSTKWQNLKQVYIVPSYEADSLNFDTTYYLYIKEIRDLSGNASPEYITAITRDSVYTPLFIRGKAMLFDSIVSAGIVLFERNGLLGISFVQHGEFKFEVRDSASYWTRVFSRGYYGAESLSTSDVGRIIFLNYQAPDLDSIIP